MQNHTPADCFTLEELQVLQSFEGQALAAVNYYLWLNLAEGEDLPYRFLYFLELIFENGDSLLLSSGEDSEAIRVSDAETLVNTARQLQELHGKVTIQRVSAGALPLWEPALGKTLAAIRLSKNEEGFYYNDSLLLDFDTLAILVRLSGKEGLEVGIYDL